MLFPECPAFHIISLNYYSSLKQDKFVWSWGSQRLNKLLESQGDRVRIQILFFDHSLCIFNTTYSPTGLCILDPLLPRKTGPSPLCSAPPPLEVLYVFLGWTISPPLEGKAVYYSQSLNGITCVWHSSVQPILVIFFIFHWIINPTQTLHFFLEFPHGRPHMPHSFLLHISVRSTLCHTCPPSAPPLVLTTRLLNSKVKRKP